MLHLGVDAALILNEIQSRIVPDLGVARCGMPCSPRRKLIHWWLRFWARTILCSGFSAVSLSWQFFDEEKLDRFVLKLRKLRKALVVGCGASLIADPNILIYADFARWEAQLRFRRNEASNLGVENRTMAANLQYKRAFFVDWRVCDRWKRPLIAKWDFCARYKQPARTETGGGRCGPSRTAPLRHASISGGSIF